MLTLRWYGGSRVTSTPPQLDGALVGSLEAGDHPQQRRLAGTRRAEHREELALGDLEVDAVDGDDVAVRLSDAREANGESLCGSVCHDSGDVCRAAHCVPSIPARNLRHAVGRVEDRTLRPEYEFCCANVAEAGSRDPASSSGGSGI